MTTMRCAIPDTVTTRRFRIAATVPPLARIDYRGLLRKWLDMNLVGVDESQSVDKESTRIATGRD
jgi:hypothetical protein